MSPFHHKITHFQHNYFHTYSRLKLKQGKAAAPLCTKSTQRGWRSCIIYILNDYILIKTHLLIPFQAA